MVALQCLIDAITVLPIYLLFKACKLPTWVALMAALTYAVYPMFSQASSVAMAETFSCMMAIWILLTLVQAANSGKAAYWFLAGALLGLMVLFRPDTIFFGGGAGLWLLVHQFPHFPVRKLLVSGLALVVGWAIFIVGWGLYNLAYNGRLSFSRRRSAHSVRVMDDRRREPQHTALNGLEQLERDDGWGGGRGHGGDCRRAAGSRSSKLIVFAH